MKGYYCRYIRPYVILLLEPRSIAKYGDSYDMGFMNNNSGVLHLFQVQ